MAYKTKAIALDNSFGSYVDSAKRSLGDYFSGIGKKSLEFKNLLTNLIEPNNCGEKFKQDFSKYYEEFGSARKSGNAAEIIIPDKSSTIPSENNVKETLDSVDKMIPDNCENVW